MSERTILVAAGLGGSLLNFRGHLLKQMVSRGHRVHVCAPGFTAEEADGLTALGVTCHEIALRRARIDPLGDLRYMMRVLWLCRREKVDVSLAYTIKAVVFSVLAAWAAGVERRYALITGVGYAFTGASRQKSGLGRAARSLYSTSLSRCHHVFFQNSDDRQVFMDLGLLAADAPTTVVHGSGVDLRYFQETPPPAGPVSFLMIARLLGDKGVREYVAAARSLRQEFPDAECRLAGWIDSHPDSISEDELNAWQREGAVTFLGKLADVRPAIASAAVYVLPSYREGTPRTVLEAMATGRAIVTTNAPGCRETVVDGVNGYLVPVKSSVALAGAMRRFIVEPQLVPRMGKQSRVLAEAKYDVEDVSSAMLTAMQL